MIAGVEAIDAGRRVVGHNVVLSYFAQHQAEELDPSCDVLQTVDAVAIGDVRRRLRGLLGAFLFSGDDVYKSVRVLSGGEKSRLALAKMLLKPANLIVLDEPTNHLDMRSKLVLQDALLEYEGSCVIVSHDRDFLDPLVSRVVEVRGGSYRNYLGNVSDYIDARTREEVAAQGGEGGRGPAEGPAGTRERKRKEAELRQRRYEQLKPLQDAVAEVERTITEQEERLRAVEGQLADPEVYRIGDRARDLTAEYRSLKETLNGGYHRWNELTKELERVQALYAGTVKE
jgi:ATP-binding cassette subfamily F protein 3